jgi:G3E family GTPase
VTPLAQVRTLVFAGRRGAGKTTLIARLLVERSPDETWAVLLNERGEVALASAPGVAIAEFDAGCPCCTAQLAFRIGLTQLLREARPARLLIELGEASHVPDVLKTLRDRWLAPVIELQGVVHVTDAADPDELELGRIAAADAVCVRRDADRVARRFPGKRVLDAAAATLAALQGSSVSDPR